MKITLGLVADHGENVEPVFAGFEVKCSLAGSGIWDGPERAGGVCRKHRQKIYKTRGVLCSGQLVAIRGVIRRSFGLDSFINRLGFRRRSRGRLLNLGLWLDLIGVERHAIADRAVGVEFSLVSDLKTDLFLVIVVADHMFFIYFDSSILPKKNSKFRSCRNQWMNLWR